MAFVCPPKEETEGKTNLLQNLRNLVKDIENQMSVNVQPVCMPCCSLPVGNLPKTPHHNRNPMTDSRNENHKPPKVMVCFKLCDKKNNEKKNNNHNNSEEIVHRIKQSISRELRAGIMYKGCDCEKTNGLQDDCLRTDCRGAPECLTRPPTCGPSQFCNGKHLMKKMNSHLKSRTGNTASNDNSTNDTLKYQCFPAIVKPAVISCNCP